MACIITFARSWQALIATRALGKAGIKVITADTDRFATSFFSRYSKGNFLYPSPYSDEKGFVGTLEKKARFYKDKYKEDVMILPIHNETFIISKYKKRLSRFAKLAVEDYPKLTDVHNKRRVVRILCKHKINHPKTYVINDMLELYKIVPELNFPIFLKLPETAASIGLKKVEERDILIYEYKNIVNEYGLKPDHYPIVQEGVDGKDYCVTAILNKGKLRALMTYVNIKCHPIKSGPGVYRKNAAVPKIEEEAKRFLAGTCWHGVIELDYRMGRDKVPYFIEANPRFWGGLNQSVASNVNYPLLAYKLAMEGDCPIVSKYDRNVRTENLITALMALLDEINKDQDKKRELERLASYWRGAFKKDFKKNLDLFFRQLRLLQERHYTTKKIVEFIERRQLVKDDILDKDDPFVVLGIFYPVHLLLKHGKITKEMLTGENPKR